MQKPLETDEKGRPTKEWLEWAYHEQRLGIKEISMITGKPQSTLHRIIRDYAMKPRRSQTQVQVDREWLEQKYAVEKLPVKEIAKLAGVETGHIRHLVKKYEIPVRRPIQRQFQPSREWIWQKYIVEDLSTQQICELTGYSKDGFERLLRVHEIERKGRSLPKLEISKEELYELHVVQGLTAVRIAQKYGCHHSAVSRLIQEYKLDPGRQLVNHKAVPPLTKDELWKLYWVDMKGSGDIASLYNVGKSTVLRWFKMLDVPTRKWNGGEVNRVYTRSADPSKRFGREFNAIERSKILDRDGWQCKMPGCHCKEAWLLEIHHILPVEAGGDNALENGITLCNKCHSSIRKRELEFIPVFLPLVNLNQ